MAIKDLVPGLRKRELMPSLHREAGPLAHLQTEMNRLFDDFFSMADFGVDWPDSSLMASPRVDVSEDDKEVTITAEIPGMDDKDIQVEMDDFSISLKGEKQEEEKKKKRNWSRRELRYGAFHRVITLPAQVDGNKAKAKFRKGVLTIKAPKKNPGEGPKRIAIQTSA
jgi:HSP20 family protein